MIDIYAMHYSTKCSWIRRLLTGENSNWKTITWTMLNINESFLNKNPEKPFEKGFSSFHNQILRAWHTVSGYNPVSVIEILNQYVMYNQFIKVGGEPISTFSIKHNDMINIKIIDIISNSGQFLSFDNLINQLQTHLSLMQYNSIISSIPVKWKEILRNKVPSLKLEEYRLLDYPYIKINNRLKHISKTVNKELYRVQLQGLTKTPTAIETTASSDKIKLHILIVSKLVEDMR